MRYVGGPKNGEYVESTHDGATEIHVRATRHAEDHTPLSQETGVYRLSGFGCMIWELTTEEDLRES